MQTVHIFNAGVIQAIRVAPLLDKKTIARARGELVDPGVTLVPPARMRLQGTDLRQLRLMQASFDALAPDPYDQAKRRYRAHGELTLETNSGFPIFTRLGSSYRQAAEFNPAEKGRLRHFEPLPESLLQDLFWRLVLGAFDCLPEDFRRHPTLRVQVHQLSYRAGKTPAVSRPLGLHRDGEPYTAVALLAQCGLHGGDTIVADHEGKLVLGHALTNPLETLIFNDALGTHAVTPVLRGRRDVLLIDFTPKTCP